MKDIITLAVIGIILASLPVVLHLTVGIAFTKFTLYYLLAVGIYGEVYLGLTIHHVFNSKNSTKQKSRT